MTAQLDLIKALASQGKRIFSTEEARACAIGLEDSYIPQLLHTLKKRGMIRPLIRGLFALSNNILAGPPLHEYKIAMRLSQPGAICCWSAMAFYQLTDQVVNKVFILAPRGETKTNSPYRSYTIDRTVYSLIKTKPELYFGVQQQGLGEISFWVTDLERTLLDGLIRPQCCGGFREVLHAYQEAASRIDISCLIGYAQQYSIAVAKRLGWVLESLTLFPKRWNELKNLPHKGFIKLDPTGPCKSPRGKPHGILST